MYHIISHPQKSILARVSDEVWLLAAGGVLYFPPDVWRVLT
jgi:hypothetical protein